VEPVEVEGAIIARATLHNFDEIERKGLMIGDSVILIRSGDVIPKITKVLKDRRDGSEVEVELPKICPTCSKDLLVEISYKGKEKKKTTLVKCQNLDCPDIVVSSIKYFASKGCMNIDGLGGKIVEQLVKESIIQDILDLYKITYQDLEKLEGFKEKSINNLLESIENTKGTDCWRFLRSLGIEHVGEVASKTICKTIGINSLQVPKEVLMGLNEFGVEMANSYSNFMHTNQKLVKEMIGIINPVCPSPTFEIDETKIMNALFKVDGLGDSTFKKISSYFTFYSLSVITPNDTIDISDKARRLFNDKITLEENRYKELLQSPIMKRKRLLNAINNGEILTIAYSGGSQPNTLRKIIPLSIKDDRINAYHLDQITNLKQLTSYSIDIVTIYELNSKLDGQWYDDNKSQISNIKYAIPNLENVDIKFLTHFSDKDHMAIGGFGKETIQKLYGENIISDIESIYSLTVEKIHSIPGFSGKKGLDIIDAITKSKKCECWRFVSALQIPLFAEVNSKIICEKFGLNFVNLTDSELFTFEGIGEEMANNFSNYMVKNKETIKNLMNIIHPIEKEKIEIKKNPFKDKIVVITGTMSISRDIIKNMLEELGAKISSSVSKNTDFVIYGDKAGSKLTKAESLGVSTLTEDEMREMT
jgi:NAD-dependent DNA ligase